MEIFLFPLVNVTLFPKTTKPLNVFEPKYIQMVKDAIAEDKYIAIGFIDDPLKIELIRPGNEISFVRPILGFGKVQIIEERANGYLLVFLHGQGKAELGAVKESAKPYYVCEARPVYENHQPSFELLNKIKILNQILARWINKYFGNPYQSEMFLKHLDGPEAIISAFSAYLVKDYDLQQIILEFNDINEKIKFLYRLVESNEILV